MKTDNHTYKTMIDLNQVFKTEELKVNFLKGLLNIAKADGNVADEELFFFKNAAISLEISEEQINELIAIAVSIDNAIDLNFENKQQAIMLLREGIQLCYIDNKYGEKERQIIANIAKHLKVSTNTLDKIEHWVSEGINWIDRGNDLLTLEV